MKISTGLALVALFILAGLAARAAEPANDSAALRTALRDTMQQLRTAQGDLAAAQAAQTSFAADKKSLTDQNEALKKQWAADRMAAEKTLAALSAQNAEQKSAITRLSQELQAAKKEGEKAARAAQAAQAEVVKLTATTQALERRLADREAKNLRLYVLGSEILTRYEEFSLGNAMRAKEPFVGRTRTKLENLVQDYQDKLLDARVQP
jgi:chromosome segregation ATPase